MHKIVLTRGIQAAGKSKFAKQWALEDPEHRVRYNNDDIRNMLGKYWVPDREKLVKSIKTTFLTEAMGHRYDIIIDNMNLNPKEVEYYQNMAITFNTYLSKSDEDEYVVEFKDFKTPLEECLKRDLLRENPIGEKVIKATYEKYKSFYEE